MMAIIDPRGRREGQSAPPQTHPVTVTDNEPGMGPDVPPYGYQIQFRYQRQYEDQRSQTPSSQP